MSDNTIQLSLPRVARCRASRSWGLTSVLDGVLADRGYFDRTLILRDAAARARVIEALVQLASQPAARSAAAVDQPCHFQP